MNFTKWETVNLTWSRGFLQKLSVIIRKTCKTCTTFTYTSSNNIIQNSVISECIQNIQKNIYKNFVFYCSLIYIPIQKPANQIFFYNCT